ncbi:DUF1109 domain-containing protein [Alteriqipengyuania lutimaris]|uniref:DUF1109 domain-containing protein n=2 Tax=Alteriqipengyuania lutimaris TaxID=1538146 RepID=A0A395LP16_9SPHN|nr:DUF1109 domain-containing protein [Alteriqipengyuania lutimaris]
MRRRQGLALVAAGLGLTVILVAGVLGSWRAALAGHASPEFYIVNAMLLVLGAAAASAAVAMAAPQVGNRQDGARWGLAMVAILPLVAIGVALSQGLSAREMIDEHAARCVAWGTASGLLVFAALGGWLRRGAPVSIEAAGLYSGVAAGALGSFACGLSCPIDDMVHLGLWHVAPIPLAGLAGRLILPRLIRW